MNEFIYATWTKHANEWVKNMLNKWSETQKAYLCFPWIKFSVHTLPNQPFWMYFYYASKDTDIVNLTGSIEFRIHVAEWKKDKFINDQVYLHRGTEDGKAWFLCDQFQEIRRNDNYLITLNDFLHAHNKNLPSTMRNSIPPVVCKTEIKVIRKYP